MSDDVEYREIPGWPGYTISEDGRLRCSDGKLKKPLKNTHAYVLTRGHVTKQLHTTYLVSLAWNVPDPKMIVDCGDCERLKSVLRKVDCSACPEKELVEKLRARVSEVEATLSLCGMGEGM